MEERKKKIFSTKHDNIFVEYQCQNKPVTGHKTDKPSWVLSWMPHLDLSLHGLIT